MGKQPRHRIGWLVAKAAHLLDPAEREVVCGDLAESCESDARAILDILGLVARRQIGLWTAWQPWATLILVVAPLGMILSLISRMWADATSIDAWVYLGHWDWSFFRFPSLRADLLRVLFLTTRDYLALMCWAWTCGFAITSLSRRTARLNMLMFCVILLAGTVGSSTTMRNGGGNPASPSHIFMSVIASTLAPAAVKLFAVAIPAWFGMRRTLSGERIALRTALLWTAAIAAITVASHTAVEESASFFGWRPFGPMPNPGFDHNLGTNDDIVDWKLRVLPFVVMWPAVYMLATTTWQRFRSADLQVRDATRN
jgi:hypothetical protein